jgi:transcription initiation factor TFIID TATA-box-binding protein
VLSIANENPSMNISSEKRKLQVEIQNVVATGNLNQKLDLYSIFNLTSGAEYNSQRFPGLIYRLKKPKTTTLIFNSGKLVCTGAKSERSAKAAINRIVKELRDHSIVILRDPQVSIQNIVATSDLKGTIDLELLALCLTKTIYEPEQFPGLIYRLDQPKTVFLIFTNGKLVITGAKKEIEPLIAAEKLRETLEKNKLITYDSLNEKALVHPTPIVLTLNQSPTIGESLRTSPILKNPA